MLREVPLFGALAPSLLLYFLAALLVFVIVGCGIRRSPDSGFSSACSPLSCSRPDLMVP